MITKEQLKACMPYATEANLNLFLDPLNKTMDEYFINTKKRMACFLAQLAHESGCLKYEEELASGDAYDSRTDLGNTPEIDGDGRKYKGRGLIEITGTTNYRMLSDDIHVDFITHPEKLEEPLYAALSAGWFWNRKNLNVFADKMDFLMISKRINGVNKKTGLPNGMEDRLKYFDLAKKTFGL